MNIPFANELAEAILGKVPTKQGGAWYRVRAIKRTKIVFTVLKTSLGEERSVQAHSKAQAIAMCPHLLALAATTGAKVEAEVLQPNNPLIPKP